MSSPGGEPPPVTHSTSSPGVSSTPQQRLEEDTPDPNFSTKYRAFLKETMNVDLDVTMGCASPAYGEGARDLPVYMVVRR